MMGALLISTEELTRAAHGALPRLCDRVLTPADDEARDERGVAFGRKRTPSAADGLEPDE